MLMLPNVVESGEPSVAGDICELAAACLTKFLLLGLSKLSISRQVLRLFEALQQVLLLFSYLSVSRFSIRFSTSLRHLSLKKLVANSIGISYVKIIIW